MSFLHYSKLPLPPANYDNNSNVICKPWQLPSLFEKSLSLQDHTSDRAYRHIAFEPKNKIAYSKTMHLKHELERVHGDVKAVHCNVGTNNATVISFFNILDAKHSYDDLKHKLSAYYKVYFVKPAFINNSTDSNSAEKMFVVFSSINSSVDLLDYDYMKHILRFGSIYSISEARISRSCILLNLEYHDERHGEALRANLNCSFIEGAQIMVYSATYDDEIACAYQGITACGKVCPPALSIDFNKPISHAAAPPPPPLTAAQKIMVATPLPSPVAEGESYFAVDPYSAPQYHPVSSLPPSPVALQHKDTAHPKITAAVIETSPSSSSNTACGTCLGKQDENVSYAAAVQSTPLFTNTSTTPDSSLSNPIPSPSSTRSVEKVAQQKKLEKKVPTPSSRNNSRRKRPPPSTKKATSNSVDLDRIGSGQDTRTTFMIRNIPNKYTQQMLIDYVNTTHERKYDFLYLRIDFQNKCNVGYAFINFIDPKKLFKSDKKCDLSYANIQGKQALIKKFQNSQVLSEDIAYQPKLFYSSGPRAGQEQPWPNSNNSSSSSHPPAKIHSKDDIAKHNVSADNNTI
ncbi:guanine nucleotide-binding protein subunit alpha [Mucor velutinosus]|uniref:Guanine nucleotide-binding protein subunit alpha n=1 Tax=Mucor velutinosus TaxID=708070 RepID=A0AAN7HYN9_9FUNG|nr:guanine nucleotide-binding protein subunit alpha [Mucor velutinosus]